MLRPLNVPTVKRRLKDLRADVYLIVYIRSQMSTLEMAVEELKRLPGPKVEEVAALIHQMAQDVEEQKRQAFAATFASMSADEADAFQQVIDEACERID